MVQLLYPSWLLGKPQLWLYRPFLAKWCLCFLNMIYWVQMKSNINIDLGVILVYHLWIQLSKYYIARDNIFFVSFNTLLIAKGKVYYWRRLLRVPWTARRSNQSILKEIVPSVHMKDWCWSWNANTLAIWCKELTHLEGSYAHHYTTNAELTHWKRPWCWERLKAGGEGDDRGWDGWMASPTQWAWVWVNSGNWWWTGRPGVLWSMGPQRVRHDWATELNWRCNIVIYLFLQTQMFIK